MYEIKEKEVQTRKIKVFNVILSFILESDMRLIGIAHRTIFYGIAISGPGHRKHSQVAILAAKCAFLVGQNANPSDRPLILIL